MFQGCEIWGHQGHMKVCTQSPDSQGFSTAKKTWHKGSFGRLTCADLCNVVNSTISTNWLIISPTVVLVIPFFWQWFFRYRCMLLVPSSSCILIPTWREIVIITALRVPDSTCKYIYTKTHTMHIYVHINLYKYNHSVYMYIYPPTPAAQGGAR